MSVFSHCLSLVQVNDNTQFPFPVRIFPNAPRSIGPFQGKSSQKQHRVNLQITLHIVNGNYVFMCGKTKRERCWVVDSMIFFIKRKSLNALVILESTDSSSPFLLFIEQKWNFRDSLSLKLKSGGEGWETINFSEKGKVMSFCEQIIK